MSQPELRLLPPLPDDMPIEQTLDIGPERRWDNRLARAIRSHSELSYGLGLGLMIGGLEIFGTGAVEAYASYMFNGTAGISSGEQIEISLGLGLMVLGAYPLIVASGAEDHQRLFPDPREKYTDL